MNDTIKEKIAKVYELVKRGVDGEQKAAEKALERLVKKYNLEDIDLETINQKEYVFKYTSNLDLWLFAQLNIYFFQEKRNQLFKDTWGVKEISVNLEYVDYVVLSCAYEYFKRHMKKQFNEFALPLINRCRSDRTKNKKRKELQEVFFNIYIQKSKLYKPEDLQKRKKISLKDIENEQNLSGVQGGKYNTQLSTGLYLGDGKN